MRANLTEKQYKSLEALMSLLRDLRVVNKFMIISDQRYDTIEQYKHTKLGVTIDTSWQAFYNIDEIVLLGK